MGGVCEIFRRAGGVNDVTYEPDSGGLVGAPLTLIYRGEVRFVANKDWRARRKTTRGDTGVQHGYRVQVPISACPPVHAADVIRIIDCPPDMELAHYLFFVRNLTPSTNSWVRNLLCDADMLHPGLLPPPRSTDVVSPPPAPAEGCGCCTDGSC